jgi:hypothetical protein
MENNKFKSPGWGQVRKQLLGLSDEETSFARRGFHEGNSQSRKRLEQIGRTFLLGYHAALEEDEAEALVSRLQGVDSELSSFAFEGAAMSLTMLDLLTPWKNERWLSFVRKGAHAHLYMAHAGAGWALARLKLFGKRHQSLLDPLYRFLTLTGCGHHEGFFSASRFVKDRVLPRGKLSGYGLRAFDQGLGRSLWFVDGADVERICATVQGFSAQATRMSDIWSGIGTALAMAGPAPGRSEIEFLRKAARPYESHLAQGAAFAAKARQRAGNQAPHTRLACEVLCETTAERAAEITDIALRNLPADREVPAYEIWRRRIQTHFSGKTATL